MSAFIQDEDEAMHVIATAERAGFFDGADLVEFGKRLEELMGEHYDVREAFDYEGLRVATSILTQRGTGSMNSLERRLFLRLARKKS